MLKKSKVVALLAVCVMMFAVVEPALAWNWGGSIVGGIAGAILGGAAVVFTGGAARPFVVGGAMMGASVGGADNDPKSGVVGGAGAGLGAQMMYEAWKNQPQPQPQPQPMPR